MDIITEPLSSKGVRYTQQTQKVIPKKRDLLLNNFYKSKSSLEYFNSLNEQSTIKAGNDLCVSQPQTKCPIFPLDKRPEGSCLPKIRLAK